MYRGCLHYLTVHLQWYCHRSKLWTRGPCVDFKCYPRSCLILLVYTYCPSVLPPCLNGSIGRGGHTPSHLSWCEYCAQLLPHFFFLGPARWSVWLLGPALYLYGYGGKKRILDELGSAKFLDRCLSQASLGETSLLRDIRVSEHAHSGCYMDFTCFGMKTRVMNIWRVKSVRTQR
jgi:hypothetical protein